MTISEFKISFKPYLESFFIQKKQEHHKLISDSFIHSILSYPELLMQEGKYIRPYLAYITYLSTDGHDKEAMLRLCVAIELFHIFCLIHDDIIDRGQTRHGIDTIHTYVTKRLKSEQRWGDDHEHIGDAQALLLGDLLFSWSQELFNTSSLPLSVLQQARSLFYNMVSEVVIGQMIDVDIMTREQVSHDLIYQKIYLKTASYTFIRPMQIGCALAGGDSDIEDFCLKFGTVLGTAFQIQDDLLDIVAQPQDLKKSVLSDLKDHQHTYFTQYVFEHGLEEDKKTLESWFGNRVDTLDQKAVIDFFTSTGALAEGERLIQQNIALARQYIAKSHILDVQKQYFEQLVNKIEHRSS